MYVGQRVFLKLQDFENLLPFLQKNGIAHLDLKLLSVKVLVKAGKLSGVWQTGNCCVGMSVLPVCFLYKVISFPM